MLLMLLCFFFFFFGRMIPQRRAKRGVESNKIDSVSEVSAKSSSSAESSLNLSNSNRRGKRQPLGLLSTEINMDNATKDQLTDLEVEKKKSRVSEPKMVNTASSSSSVHLQLRVRLQNLMQLNCPLL